MTERETIERELILDILAESSKWRITEEDKDIDCIRLEVMDRARRLLLGMKTIDENGRAQSHPDNPPAEDEILTGAEHLASPEKVDEARKKWEKDKIRVYIDGKHVWKKRSECVKQPRDNSKGGPAWKWVWIDPNSPTKDEQVEAMWAEHERS